MARPRVFVSSTYYDLKHIRKSIELFIDEMGYESVLFENGDVAFDHQAPLDDSCYKELESCQIFVLVLGGRYGAEASNEVETLTDEQVDAHYKHYNSITKKEYDAARARDIPIYIFIEKGVSSEFQTYKENKDNETIKYAHVDSVNIFRLIESIFSERRNNLVREFEHADDIISWLKEQWAGLFSDLLSKRTRDGTLLSMEHQLQKLNIVAETLTEYSQTIIREMSPKNSKKIITSITSQEKIRKEKGAFVRSIAVRTIVAFLEPDEEVIFEIYKNSTSYSEFLRKISLRSSQDDSAEDLKFARAMIGDSCAELFELRTHFELKPWPYE